MARNHRGGLWRSRWAAIGAAVAVTFGGGGAFWVHADTNHSGQQSIESFVELRAASLPLGASGTAKKATPLDGVALTGQLPGAQAESLSTGATFFPITPYRSFDTRAFSDGLMIWGDGVYFDVLTDMNLNSKIPATAVAVTFNLTVTGTYGSYGFLTVFPAGAPEPETSSINWFTGGVDLANSGVVSLGNVDGPGQIAVRAGLVPDTATDFIIDITGYFQ